jgi:hypothetical protein
MRVKRSPTDLNMRFFDEAIQSETKNIQSFCALDKKNYKLQGWRKCFASFASGSRPIFVKCDVQYLNSIKPLALRIHGKWN